MKRRLTHISVLRTSAIYTLTSVSTLVVLLMMAIILGRVPENLKGQPVVPLLLATTLSSAITIYIMCVVFCAFYNLAAKWFGGVEFTSEDTDESA